LSADRVAVRDHRPQIAAGRVAQPHDEAARVHDVGGARDQRAKLFEIADAPEIGAELRGRFEHGTRGTRRDTRRRTTGARGT
jgi:hypothetical protein